MARFLTEVDIFHHVFDIKLKNTKAYSNSMGWGGWILSPSLWTSDFSSADNIIFSFILQCDPVLSLDFHSHLLCDFVLVILLVFFISPCGIERMFVGFPRLFFFLEEIGIIFFTLKCFPLRVVTRCIL